MRVQSEPCRVEPCRAGRHLRSRAVGAPAGAALSPPTTDARGSHKAPEWSVHTRTLTHSHTRAHTRTDTLTPGGCGNGPPRRLLRVPTPGVPLSPVSPPCPRCVPSVSPLSPCRGDAGALCTRSGVPRASDARRGAHCTLCPQSSWESRSPCAPNGPSVLGMMVFPLFPELLRVPLSLEIRTVPCVPQSSQKFPHPPVSRDSHCPLCPRMSHCPLCPQQPHGARGSAQQHGWVWARVGDGFHFGATTEPRDGGAERLR